MPKGTSAKPAEPKPPAPPSKPPHMLQLPNEAVEGAIKQFGKPTRTKPHGLDQTVLYWE